MHEAVRDDLLRAAVETALDTELVPAVPAADGLSAVEDAQDSLRRFANSAVPHRLAQVGAGGSTKLPQRLSAVVESCVATGRAPTWSAAVVAAWAHAVGRGDVDDDRAADVRAALDRPAPPGARAAGNSALTRGGEQDGLVVDALTGWLEAWDRDGTQAGCPDVAEDGTEDGTDDGTGGGLSMDLTDKVAVVTGGGTGIGAAIAHALVQTGARGVLVTWSRSEEAAAGTVTSLRAAGAEAEAVAVDVRVDDQVPALAARCQERFGGCDVRVNNAASTAWLPFARPPR